MEILRHTLAMQCRMLGMFGKKDIQGTRMAGFASIALICLFMILFATTFISFRSVLPGFYISENDVIVIASQILIIAGVFQVSDGIQAVSAGMLRGVMDVNIPTVITFTAYWVIGIPVGYVLGIRMHYGVTGVWVGLLTGLTASAVMMLVRFHLINRSRKSEP